MFSLLFVLAFPVPAGAVQTWRILAIRVSFPKEVPDDPTTSGNGTFDLRTFEEARPDYRFPFDTPPHDRAYFEAHLQALANYYRDVSGGRVDIQYEVYPRAPDSSYVLNLPLKDYGNGRTSAEIDQRVTQLFRDGIAAADSAGGPDFSSFNAFVVFHAGLGAEAGQQALNDVPSAFINQADLDRYVGGPIPVHGGQVESGMLLPEAISTTGQGGLNGTMARFFAYQLGLPTLSDVEDDLPAVGGWSLMDTGANSFASATRLGISSLSNDPADTALVGFIPSRMLAWSRIRLGWLVPKVVTHNDTVRIVAPYVNSDLPQAVKIPISATEYYLLENRISRLAVYGRKPHIELSQGTQGVWLSTDDYDAFIPGSGILIWHVDDTVINAADDQHPINSNPDYQIASAQYRRGISLEEADGLQDIGNVSADRIISGGVISLSDIEGDPKDPYYVGNKTVFGPNTTPATTSNLGYPTGITIQVLSPPGDTMAVAITFARQQGAWPVTGLAAAPGQAPRAVDLNGDGSPEILRASASGPSAFALDGSPVDTLQFSASFPPAVGALSSGGGSTPAFVFADGGVPALWQNGHLSRTPADSLPASGATVSAAPILAPFTGGVLTDVWGWSDGRVEWGRYAGTPGAVSLDAGPVTGLAIAHLENSAANDLVAVTGSGRVFEIPDSGQPRLLAALSDSLLGAPVSADLNGDGQDEVVVLSKNGTVSILDVDGLRFQSRPVPGGATSPPVLADLDGDGYVEVLFGGTGRLWAVRFNGILQTDTPLAFPLKDESGPIEAPPVVADIDGDGVPDILAASPGGLVYGFRATGAALPGFPLSVPGPVRTSPLLGDLNGDGKLDLVVFTENGAVRLWHLPDIDPSFTGHTVIWGQAGGGPGNAGHLLQTPQSVPPAAATSLLTRAYCYPNPIRASSAYLRFFLSDNARVRVTVLNALGEVVDHLALDAPTPNTDNEIPWNTSGYASGLYICRIEAVAANRSEVRFVKAAVIR